LNGDASELAGGGAIIRATVLVAVALAAVHATGSSAQGFPVIPVRVVVPLVRGGNLDIVARAVPQRLADAFGRQFVVENRPGASSLVGTQYVAKSAPETVSGKQKSMNKAESPLRQLLTAHHLLHADSCR